jgi:hypothetical protein
MIEIYTNNEIGRTPEFFQLMAYVAKIAKNEKNLHGCTHD